MPFLVTPPLPSLKVEIAFDSGFMTAEGDRTWTDVSTWVEGDAECAITYGRADELSTPDPNTCSLTLDNRDGRFTPGKASSPYFPDVKKGKPLRVTVTYAGVDYIRFTGYVNEWPLVWPDGSSAASSVTISASSRRARLGQTAPLTSAIRAAYLASSPDAYWPMDEEAGVYDLAGRTAFRDVTNANTTRERQSIGSFYSSTIMAPSVQDGTAGPTDETSLVRIPAFNDPLLVGTYPHYVGGGSVVSVNTGGGYVTVEVVARIRAQSGDVSVTIINLFSPNFVNTLGLTANDQRDLGGGAAVAGSIIVRDPLTGALLENQGDGSLTLFDTAADGEIHHYAMVLSAAGTNAKIYFDGVQIGNLTIVHAMTKRMTEVAMGPDTYNANLWVGHAAVYDRAFTAAEVLAHAQAATATSETDAERVVRVAGRIGVPADEIDVETGIAAPLGPQGEAGRTAAEVLDEMATSERGILYDTRAGHLALQARSHRYNQSAAFSLSAELQEVQGDLTAVTDDRYLINTVEFSRVGAGDVPSTVTDPDSIEEYGVYSTSLQIVSSSDEETRAAAQDIIFRFGDGGAVPRVSQVSMDIVNLDAVKRAAVLAADIGTLFDIEDLPAQAPVDPMPLFLEGYTESISATSHTLTANTTPGDLYANVAVLDDPTHDVLGSGITLAY